MSSEVVTLSNPERKVLAALLNDEATPLEVIPADATAAELMANLSICSTVLGRIEKASGKLKALIGRYLAVIRQSPHIYRERGYDSFEKFVNAEVVEKLGLSRSSLWEAKKIAEAFPGLQMSDYEEIGTTKLILASKITSSDQPGHQKVLNKAKDMTVEEFRKYTMDASGGHDDSKASVVLTGGRSDIQTIERFIGNDKMKLYLEVESSARMVAMAITESGTTWEAEIAEESRGKK